MAQAKILHAVMDEQGFHFLVHLDQDWTVGDHEAHDLNLPAGSPHPQFVKRWDFGNRTPGVHQQNGKDMTEAEYLASIEAMLKEQIALERQGLRFYQPAPKPFEIVDALHGKEL